MIYGYVEQIVDKRWRLAQMREVSVSTTAESLRALAAFLRNAADALEAEPRTILWHLHAPDELREALGCDFIVLVPDDGHRPVAVLPVVGF